MLFLSTVDIIIWTKLTDYFYQHSLYLDAEQIYLKLLINEPAIRDEELFCYRFNHSVNNFSLRSYFDHTVNINNLTLFFPTIFVSHNRQTVTNI
jgi:hypothetical protein